MRRKEDGSPLYYASPTFIGLTGVMHLFPLRYVPGTAAPPELLIRPTHGNKTDKHTRTHPDPVTISLQPPGSPPSASFRGCGPILPSPTSSMGICPLTASSAPIHEPIKL